MADLVTVKVQGLTNLGERMRNLSEDMNKKIARSATGAAASVVKKAAERKAPVDTGNLKRNIIAKRIPPARTQHTSEHIVTVRKGKLTEKQKGSGLQDAFYASWVEFGTAKMAARPFLRPAFDQNIQAAIDAMKKKIEQRLDKAGV